MSEPVKRIEFELTELGKVYVLASDYDTLAQRCRELEHRCGALGLELENSAERKAQAERTADTLRAEVEEARRTAGFWKDEHLAGNRVIDQLRAEVADLKARLLEAERGNESCCGCGRRGASSR